MAAGFPLRTTHFAEGYYGNPKPHPKEKKGNEEEEEEKSCPKFRY
jgi:hypothetical protein